MFFSPSPSVSSHSFCQIFIIMSNFSDACFPVFVEIENKHIFLFQMIILKNFFMTGVLYFSRVSILIFTSVSISLPRSYTVLEITASPSFTKTSVRFRFTNIMLNHLIQKYGRLPDDYKIVGFDDSPVSREAIVPISTVGQQIDKIAASAMEILHEQITERHKRKPALSSEPVHKIIPPILIRRETT